MRYILKQKLLAVGDDFHIKNDEGDDVYFVDGKAFTIGDRLAFQDLEGNELAFIRQRVLSLRKTYEIVRDGAIAARVTKKLIGLFHHRFTVDVPGPDDLEIEGDFFDHEYTFKRGDRIVATVSKRWVSLTSTYGVEIEPGEDPVLILASAVVVDQVCHGDGDDGH
jgi:uncharacterized protein YxjI